MSESRLLQALKSDDLALLETILEPCEFKAGRVLYEPGDTVHSAYFPCGSALASFRVMMEDGSNVESALVGREGAVGGIVSQGRLPAFARCSVEFSGHFLRADTKALEDLKGESITLRYFFARYADCLLAQVFQAVACNASHSIEQRAAKWLISAIERTGSQNVPMTQEQLADRLGVGRSYVNRVIRGWRDHGILQTARGKLYVRDLPSLDRLACECDTTVRRHFEHVLRGVYPEHPVRNGVQLEHFDL